MPSQYYDYIEVTFIISGFLVPLYEIIFKKDADKKRLKKVSKIGWICLTIALLWGTESFFRIRQRTIDENNKNKFNDSIRKEDKKEILDGIGEAIGKYGLKYDSANKQFDSINSKNGSKIDSLKNYIKSIKSGVAPNLANFLDFIKETDDSITYKIGLSTQSAPSIFKHGMFYEFYSFSSNNNITSTNIVFFRKGEIFTKNSGIVLGINPTTIRYLIANKHNAVYLVKTIVVVMKYSYTDSYNQNLKKVMDVDELDLNTKEFSKIASPLSDSIINLTTKL